MDVNDLEVKKSKLSDLFNNMDIPSARRDLSLDHNIKWISRNLAFRNSDHPDFKEAISLTLEIISLIS